MHLKLVVILESDDYVTHLAKTSTQDEEQNKTHETLQKLSGDSTPSIYFYKVKHLPMLVTS